MPRSLHLLWSICNARLQGLFCAAVLLAGCLGATAAPPLESWLTGQPRWQQSRLPVGPWHVLMVSKAGQGAPVVYIEGDGRSYISKDTPSTDPTPHHPIGLQLALADVSGRPVIYVARPCQWVKAEEGPLCATFKSWTTERYTESIAQGYATALYQATAGQPFSVIGYSGGAWVAMQVAARVPTVAHVQTVAGNILPNSFNRLHRVPAQTVAPYPNLGRLAALPQRHVVGNADRTVPASLAQEWLTQIGFPPTATVQTISATHTTGLYLPLSKQAQ